MIVTVTTVTNLTRRAHGSGWPRRAGRATGRGVCSSTRSQRSRELGVVELWETPGLQGQFTDERLEPAIQQAAIDASAGVEWLSQSSDVAPAL